MDKQKKKDIQLGIKIQEQKEVLYIQTGVKHIDRKKDWTYRQL